MNSELVYIREIIMYLEFFKLRGVLSVTSIRNLTLL